MFYFNELILCKVSANQTVSPNVEIVAIKFPPLKQEWLLLRVCKAPIQSDSEFTEEFTRILHHYIPSYENILLLCDLNMATENLHFNNLMQIFNVSALIKTPKCSQSHNLTCINTILTNQKALLKLSKTFETGLSDHHKLISTIMKSGSFKASPRKKVYRLHRYFDTLGK